MAAVLIPAAPAAAATTGPSAAPRAAKSEVQLTYMADAGYAAAVRLTCHPTGGPHPEAAAACRTLDRVGADLGRITPNQLMCTMEYAPITAGVTGTWKGRKVEWSHVYSNPCEMSRATGVVFAF